VLAHRLGVGLHPSAATQTGDAGSSLTETRHGESSRDTTTSAWIVQQLREAFPFEPSAKFLILDHDAKYGTEVPTALRSMEITPLRTAIGCPWQNGVAERWVGNCRRELLDHVIAVNSSHMKRLLASYIDYYHQDRTHCGLQKQTPVERPRCVARGKVVSWPRVGGLHHRYDHAA